MTIKRERRKGEGEEDREEESLAIGGENKHTAHYLCLLQVVHYPLHEGRIVST